MPDDRRMRLLELYEARGDPDTFAEAKRLYEQALAGAEASDPETLIAYGYLLECHGRYALRQAVAQYQRAITLDPDADKPHYQHIWAQAALRETEPAIALHSERLARSPTDVREHRFLANAYLAARDYQEAARVVDAGLALAPDDPMLLDLRGDARAATGDPDGALADWRRAVEVDADNLSPVYSSALLLERLGRLEEAAAAWQSVIAWCDSHQAPLTAEWPRQELARLRVKATTIEPFDAGTGWPGRCPHLLQAPLTVRGNHRRLGLPPRAAWSEGWREGTAAP